MTLFVLCGRTVLALDLLSVRLDIFARDSGTNTPAPAKSLPWVIVQAESANSQMVGHVR